MVNLANNCDILACLLVLVLVLKLVVGFLLALGLVLVLVGLVGDDWLLTDLDDFIEPLEPCFNADDDDGGEDDGVDADGDLVEALRSFLLDRLSSFGAKQCLLLFVIFNRVKVVRGGARADCCILLRKTRS